MKNILYILFVIGLCSCQEVITIDLNSASPKLIVEGYVRNKPGPYFIKLSRTTNYFDANTFKAESGAQVIISDNVGNRDTLRETLSGLYSTTTLGTAPGRTYSLFINTLGQKYTAIANLYDTVSIDSLAFAFHMTNPNSGQLPYYTVTCSFTDPIALGNNYGMRVNKNGQLKNDIVDNRIISDKLLNGNVMHPKLRNNDLRRFDTARVDLINFDKSAFDFYSTLKKALSSGGPFSSPPANPVTNLSNNALGYFGAFAITTRTIVIAR